MHRTGQECLRRALIRPANHNDQKRPKLAEIDSSTYIENTPYITNNVHFGCCDETKATLLWREKFCYKFTK